MALKLGAAQLAEADAEVAWRAAVLDAAKAAFRWPSDEVEVQRLQEVHGRYLRWTFLSTVAVMIVGLIAMGLSF
jgi:hypothetical protein